MRRYIRSRIGHVYFFTIVTHDRRPILTTDLGRSSLRDAIQSVRSERPFQILAIVLLPDQLHAVWELPEEDQNYSTRWRLIKARFTRQWTGSGGDEGSIGSSRLRKAERGIWQRRFYEHTCQNEDDLSRCIDYVHINPLKHHLVNRVIDWPWSSFHRYERQGAYPPDWGSHDIWYGDEFKNAE